MKTFVPLLLALASMGCRTGRLAPQPQPQPQDLEAHLADAQAGAGKGPGEPEAPSLADKTLAIMKTWDAQVAKPERFALVRAFGSDAYAPHRKAARAPEFADSLAAGLSEPRLLAAVFERSPRIQAAHRKLRATVNQFAQVTAVDTILGQYASFQRDARTHVGMPLAGERMDQHFPFPGSLELKAALVRHALQEARARYAAAVRDAVVEARTLFARYVFVGRSLRISEAMLAYLQQLEEAARSKLSAGTGAKGAVIQVQVEIADLRNRLLTLAQERRVMRAGFARMLDLPPDTAIGPPSPAPAPQLPGDLAKLRAAAPAHQPDVQAAEARVRRMQTMIELAEQTAYPAFSPGLSTLEGISHATGGSDKEREPFSTRPKTKPDPWFGGKEAYLREARDRVRAAQAHAVDVRNRTTFAVESAHAAMETALRLRKLYEDVQLSQAEQAYRDAASGYAADRVEFLNVVDALRRWLRFRLEADRALRDLHIGDARLEGALGRETAAASK